MLRLHLKLKNQELQVLSVEEVWENRVQMRVWRELPANDHTDLPDFSFSLEDVEERFIERSSE